METEKDLLELARLFLDVVGVDAGDVTDAASYSDSVIKAVAADLEVFAAALAAYAPELPELADTIARWARRIEAARDATPLIARILPALVASSDSD